MSATAVINGAPRRLDYVLVRTAHEADVLPFAPWGEPSPGRPLPDATCPSDHLRLFVRLTLP